MVDDARIWTSLRFSDTTGFVPTQMEVQEGSNVRGEIPGRLCLLGRDNATYRTYALPKDWDAAGKMEQDGGTTVELAG